MNQEKFDSGVPFLSTFQPEEGLEWQMSRAEKYALLGLLDKIKPDYSIEIGTYQGGSLQVISRYSRQVVSIDISKEPKRILKDRFENVDFIVGNSHEILHEVFEKIEREGRTLNFILVDGDHSKNGVYNDLKSILDYPHKNSLTVILHDSYNPQCRKGMRKINYSDYKNIEYIELDYIPGTFWHNDTYREMWGGFALIQIGNKAKNLTEVHLAAKKPYAINYLHSIHLLKDAIRFLAPLEKKFYKIFGLKHKSEKYMNFEK